MTTVNILDMQNTLDSAVAIGKMYIEANPEGSNWYPCGFVWLTYQCRKNAKQYVALVSRGWRWDDYAKQYTYSIGQLVNTQSMNYMEDIGRAMLNNLRASGIEGFGIQTRID